MRTSFVNVRHSLFGTPPISLRTRVFGPRTGPRGTMMIWAVEVARAPRRAMPVVNFMLTGLMKGLRMMIVVGIRGMWACRGEVDGIRREKIGTMIKADRALNRRIIKIMNY